MRYLVFSIILMSFVMGFDREASSYKDEITGLYIAYFNRAPDKEGLDYWTNKANNSSNGNEVLKELSAGFAKHPVFISTYGNLNNREFVKQIYRNCLGRDGDEDGINYWTGYLDAGKSRSDMVAEFIDASLNSELTKENYPTLSDEELAIAQARKDLISNKVEIGLKFVELLEDKTNIKDSQNPENDPAYKASQNILRDVTENKESVISISNFLYDIKSKDNPIDEINLHYAPTKITIHNRAYSTNSITGIYISHANDKYWGDNYLDFELHPNYRLSKPIEISDCSEKYDIKIVYNNEKKLEFYDRFIECGKNYDWWFNDKGIEFEYENTFVYNQNSKYKNYLEECPLYDFNIDNIESCKLNQLPLLAQENKIPTKDLIMNRVVVSQKWMGDRFSELLDILDDDIKQLLGAVTAIVIDEDINPSFYWSKTGAIYLDPRGLWLTPEEAETIIDKDDYRDSYGNELKFEAYWRYIKNNREYAYYNTDWKYKEHNTTRTIDDIKYKFTRLLYHELAHANDYIPPDLIDELNSSETIYSITSANYKNSKTLSKKLYEDSPLKSQELIDIGKVLYHGYKATEEQKNMSAEDVGVLFEDDMANEMYSYSTKLEDLADLFEATMMKYHYGFELDVGFTNKDYILGWGARNRIAKSDISDRALFVVKSILPTETDWDEFFAKDVGELKLLEAGKSWWDSRIIGEIKTDEQRKRVKIPDIREIYFNERD